VLTALYALSPYIKQITTRIERVKLVWNNGGMILTGESWNNRTKTYSIASLSTINLTWNGLGLIPCLHVDRPATECLSHGTALVLSGVYGMGPCQRCIWHILPKCRVELELALRTQWNSMGSGGVRPLVLSHDTWWWWLAGHDSRSGSFR
jgi:hypothetical protein